MAGFGVGDTIALGVADGAAVFPAGFGVGVGLVEVLELATGIGTRITPSDWGMNWLPPFGSMVTV